MADLWQLTQGGSEVKHQCQSTIAELRHSAKNFRTAWSEKVIIIIRDFLTLYDSCKISLKRLKKAYPK